MAEDFLLRQFSALTANSKPALSGCGVAVSWGGWEERGGPWLKELLGKQSASLAAGGVCCQRVAVCSFYCSVDERHVLKGWIKGVQWLCGGPAQRIRGLLPLSLGKPFTNRLIFLSPALTL